jgi:hypothetical protein
MVRGEMPIELGASWFSSKCVEAQRYIMNFPGVKLCLGEGCESGTNLLQTKNTGNDFNLPVRLRGTSFVVKRETAQTTS